MTDTVSSEARAHLGALDLLRGIAVLLVLFFHAQIELVPGYRLADEEYGQWLIRSDVGASRLIWNLLPSAFGASGVELFLLISGYLIHRAWLNSRKPLAPFAFYSRRAWRIVPPYLISIIVLAPILIWSGGTDLLLHILMLHNWYEPSFFGLNPSYWSLALEVQLYLIYPIVLVLRSRIGMRRVLFLLAALSFSTTIFQYFFHCESVVLDKSIMKFWLFWFLGSYLAEVHINGKVLFSGHGMLLVAVGLLVVLSKLTVFHHPLKFYLYTLFHAVLLEWVLVNRGLDSRSALWGRSFRLLSVIGVWSYSLYLYHQPLMIWFFGRARQEYDPLLKSIYVSSGVVLIFLFAYLSYRFVELPSISAGKRFARSRLFN